MKWEPGPNEFEVGVSRCTECNNEIRASDGVCRIENTLAFYEGLCASCRKPFVFVGDSKWAKLVSS